jgi:hypothetical protein
VEKRKAKQHLCAEWKKVRALGPKAGLAYLWQYYKLPVLAAVAAVGLAVYFVNACLTRPADPVLTVQFVNFYSDVSAQSDFARNFAAFGSLDSAQGPAVFDANAFFNLANSSDYTNSYYLKTVTYLETGTRDAVVCGRDNLEGLAQSGRLMDLTDSRTAAICDAWGSRLYTVTGNGQEIPVGVSLAGSPVLSKMQQNDGDIYLAVSANVQHEKWVETFLHYLLDGAA